MRKLGDAKLGCQIFGVRVHSANDCGSNGLPLTPCSIRIHGRFQKFKAVIHERLAQYISCVKCKSEHVVVVFEYYDKEFHWDNQPIAKLLNLSYQLLQALNELHKRDIVHRCLSWSSLMIDANGNLKLGDYALYSITAAGGDVTFPIGHPFYIAPEVLTEPDSIWFEYDESITFCEKSSDVWSIGLILLEMFCKTRLYSQLSLKQRLSKTLIIFNEVEDACSHILDENHLTKVFADLPQFIQNVVRSALINTPSSRSSVEELLALFPPDIFEKNKVSEYHEIGYPFTKISRSNAITRINYSAKTRESCLLQNDAITERKFSEVYHLYILAGGDVEFEFSKHKFEEKRRPPINSLPNIITVSGEYMGREKQRLSTLNNEILCLSLKELRSRLKVIKAAERYPLLSFDHGHNGLCAPRHKANKLPVVIKEKDIEYQFIRMVLFERLLRGFPYTRDLLWNESRLDIPPFYRAWTWAALLNVSCDDIDEFLKTDLSRVHSIDRQIDVDVPRCHQYDILLSSPSAHRTLKSVLKAWVIAHPNLSYWQGLDSLAAPFVWLNFTDPALAYACLAAFINKFLYEFFLQDNTRVIDEYLATFSQIIAFHDPQLFNHLNELGFRPNLYAIPWFLTMFAHIFHLNKIFHLWDALLLGNSSFPLFIGVAILRLLRDRLLESDFNDCILLFSDLPDLDIELVVSGSIELFNQTPGSCTWRQSVANKSIFLFQNATQYTYTPFCIDFIPIIVKQQEVVPRISGQDVLYISNIINESQTVAPKSCCCIMDIRPVKDFEGSHLPKSINFPRDEVFNFESLTVTSSSHRAMLKNFKDKLVVIVSDDLDVTDHIMCSKILIKHNLKKVCVLHQGISTFEHSGLLIQSM